MLLPKSRDGSGTIASRLKDEKKDSSPTRSMMNPPLRPNLTPQMKYMNIGSLRNEVGPLIDELMVSIQSDAVPQNVAGNYR